MGRVGRPLPFYRRELLGRLSFRRLTSHNAVLGAAALTFETRTPMTVHVQRDWAPRVLSARARNSAMLLSLAAWYAHPSAVAFQR